MRKLFLSLALAIISLQSLMAQEPTTPELEPAAPTISTPVVETPAEIFPHVTGYVKLDYVASSLTFTPNFQSPSTKSNVLLALGFNYKFNPYWAAYAELGIAGLGADDVNGGVKLSNGQIQTGKSDLHFGTILIPVGLKFYPIPEIGLTAGFNLGIIAAATGKYKEERVKYTNFSSGNHAFNFGIEGHFSKKVFAEMRYNIGLSDISTTDQPGLKIRNNFFQIGLGIEFPVKK
jgi:Outer membrane protein beta-barrel domain